MIRRYKRMRGYEVVMTTGTDEHGVNVERAAKKSRGSRSEYVAKMAATWRALWDELGIAADNSFERLICSTCAPYNGCSNSAGKMVLSTRDITPANTAFSTTPLSTNQSRGISVPIDSLTA